MEKQIIFDMKTQFGESLWLEKLASLGIVDAKTILKDLCESKYISNKEENEFFQKITEIIINTPIEPELQMEEQKRVTFHDYEIDCDTTEDEEELSEEEDFSQEDEEEPDKKEGNVDPLEKLNNSYIDFNISIGSDFENRIDLKKIVDDDENKEKDK